LCTGIKMREVDFQKIIGGYAANAYGSMAK
jgi:hypothetical protein